MIVAGLTLSAAAVAAIFTGQISPADPVTATAAEADPPTPQAELDPWAIGESGPGSNPVGDDFFAVPVADQSLRAPVDVAARGTGAALRLFQPANIPTATYADLPAPALAAYQRAAVVLEAADRRCAVDWQLVAAVGRVRSDHGRSDGGTLSASGVVRPALVGRRLDGRHGTPRISDTDAGQLDGDRRFDRTVGPMQVLPSTWSVVGVDADGDGKRNPQDVDDAALSSAVHLCAGQERLDTRGGRVAALRRLDRTAGWADLVLRVRRDYRADTPTVPDTPARTWSAAPGLGAWEIDDPAAVLKEAEKGLAKHGHGRAGAAKKGRGTHGAKARNKHRHQGANQHQGTKPGKAKGKGPTKGRSTAPGAHATGPGTKPGTKPGKDAGTPPGTGPKGPKGPKGPETDAEESTPEPPPVDCADASTAVTLAECPEKPAAPGSPDPQPSTPPSGSQASPDPKPTPKPDPKSSPKPSPKATGGAEAETCEADPGADADDPADETGPDGTDCLAARKE